MWGGRCLEMSIYFLLLGLYCRSLNEWSEELGWIWFVISMVTLSAPQVSNDILSLQLGKFARVSIFLDFIPCLVLDFSFILLTLEIICLMTIFHLYSTVSFIYYLLVGWWGIGKKCCLMFWSTVSLKFCEPASWGMALPLPQLPVLGLTYIPSLPWGRDVLSLSLPQLQCFSTVSQGDRYFLLLLPFRLQFYFCKKNVVNGKKFGEQQLLLPSSSPR